MIGDVDEIPLFPSLFKKNDKEKITKWHVTIQLNGETPSYEVIVRFGNVLQALVMVHKRHSQIPKLLESAMQVFLLQSTATQSTVSSLC